MSQRNVLIVGGGVIGFSCAWYLSRAGHRVTVVEKRAREAPNCSTGNAGLVVPSHFTPLAAPGMISMGLKWMFNPESPFAFHLRPDPALLGWVWRFFRASRRQRCEAAMPVLRDLSLRSRELFAGLAGNEGWDFGLESRGLLMLCRSQAALDEEGEAVTRARELGLEAELLDPAGAAARDPDIAMDVKGAAFFPQDCQLNPARFRQCLIDGVENAGGEINWETEVTKWREDGGKVREVVTRSSQGGERVLEADEFVIAGGVWSKGLMNMLGIRLPMQAGKGYSMTLENPAERPGICALLKEARIAVTPLGGSVRFGGTMEIGAGDESVSTRRIKGIAKSIPAYYPAFQESDFTEEPVWSGLRPCSPDGLPYLGRIPRWKNLSIAAGHAMLGLSLAPVTGQILARMLSGEEVEMDLQLLAPERYS